MSSTQPSHAPVPWRDALRVWLRIGLNSFGGPAGQIAVMHRVLVEEKRWVSEERFLHALNFCMLLPGPEAQQLAVYIGWLLHRTLGGLVAGILFVLPGAVAMMLLAALFATSHDIGWVRAVFFGVQCAVLAVVLQALLRIGRRALKRGWAWVVAALAFVALAAFGIPFPLVVGGALAIGFALGRFAPEMLSGGAAEAHAAVGPKSAEDAIGPTMPDHARPSITRAVRAAAVGLAVWFAPLVAVAALYGRESVFAQMGLFFSKAACVTFGGAYAVLAYVSHQAVDVHGWMKPDEMVTGLGLAETTPGPLILVLQFVGFVGAYRFHGALEPMRAGLLGACVTLWATFAPCFVWIFVGAPWVEALRTNRALAGALAAVTAAVVGVIANLALWFALHTLFASVAEIHVLGARVWTPEWSTLDVRAALLVLAALVATFRFRIGMLWTIGACALAGVALRAFG